MNNDAKENSIEELKTENKKSHLNIVIVCCFFLILVISGMCVLKNIAEEIERPSVRSQIESNSCGSPEL